MFLFGWKRLHYGPRLLVILQKSPPQFKAKSRLPLILNASTSIAQRFLCYFVFAGHQAASPGGDGMDFARLIL
ncbi:hypothetical protein BEN47_09880 [Hymenobacter lapidarius]|uniref:Uncharacterized protein n=1 Tax=Hymenobacter lapidarius TaxID=1908237 RepID=A0A1G1TAZ2_9BACT|nr:hypothetical protein BEN47_09880 [Hymenobacter lapidarius]